MAPCRTRTNRVAGLGQAASSSVSAAPPGLPPAVGAADRSSSCRVHRLVGKPVGVRVLLARDPLEGDGGEPTAQLDGFAGQRRSAAFLTCQRALHLLDDQLGVHPHRDLGSRRARAAARSPAIRPRYSATLLVAIPIELRALGQRRRRCRRRARPRRSRPGQDCPRDRRRPRRRRAVVPLTGRTRRRAHQDAAAVLAAQHLVRRGGARRRQAREPDSSMRQPSQRRWRSMAAPTPPPCSRARSYSASRSAGSSAAIAARSLARDSMAPSISPNASSRVAINASRSADSSAWRRVSAASSPSAFSRCSMTSSSSSSRDVCRRASVVSSCCSPASSLAGRPPARSRCSSRSARARTASTSFSRRRCACGNVACSRLGVDKLVVQLRARVLPVGDRGQLGQRSAGDAAVARARCRRLAGPAVAAAQSGRRSRRSRC